MAVLAQLPDSQCAVKEFKVNLNSCDDLELEYLRWMEPDFHADFEYEIGEGEVFFDTL